ncbi:MAG: hypothetical protein ABJA37_03900 [Ferruginibacter sp.]
MKKLFLLIVALYTVQYTFGQDTGSKLDTLLNAYAKLYKFNGSALVAKNGVILLNKGYGYRDAANRVLNN